MGLSDLFKSKEEKLWNFVYNARQSLWEQQFGSFPKEVQKLMNLTGIWPGGCLIQTVSEKLGGVCVTSSFGLTNSDMPTRARLEKWNVDKTKDTSVSYEQVINQRVPKQVPNDWAGYGYEIALITKEQVKWPYMFLNTIIQMEILQDVGVLERVNEIGAVTVEKIRIGETEYGNFIIFIAQEPIMTEFKLPNGKAKLLLAMNITNSEMLYALEHGQRFLLEALIEKNIAPISNLKRESIF